VITHGRGNGSKSLISIFTTRSAKSPSLIIWCNFIFHSPTPLSLTFPFSQTITDDLIVAQNQKRSGYEKMMELFRFMRSVFERPQNFDAISVQNFITKHTDAVVDAFYPDCTQTLRCERTGHLRMPVQLIVGRAME
jgi:hypothetical protein